MRVMIDARKSGFGITSYCENLISNLARIDRRNRYVILRSSNDRQETMEAGNFKTVYVSYPLFSIRTLLFLHRILHRERVDVFHSPSVMFPLFGKCRMVLTLHDLIPLRFYRGHSRYRLLPFWIIRVIFLLVLSKADQIITGSQFTRSEISTLAHSFQRKTNVIYHASSDLFERKTPEDHVQRVKSEFPLCEKMVLYAGSMKPHKNVDRLLTAFSRMEQNKDVDDVCLVLGGGEKENIARLKKLAVDLGIDGKVVFTGRLRTEKLAGLMNLAQVFVFPSLYEGFGLPPLEAMACGTPVVASNASSLPEVVGDAALLVDPRSVEDIASAIERLLTDQRLREEIIIKGFDRAKRYSWEKTAQQTLEVYRRVAEEQSRVG